MRLSATVPTASRTDGDRHLGRLCRPCRRAGYQRLPQRDHLGCVAVISAVALLALVAERQQFHSDLHELIERAGIPFDEPMAEAAVEAFKRCGKGQGHKAQLKIIDCAAYAITKTRDLSLLFKGNDLAATDIRTARSSRP